MSSTLREVRRTLRSARRLARDVVSGDRWKLAAPAGAPQIDDARYPRQLAMEQSAGGTAHAEAKRHNIMVASAAINRVLLDPGAIFSFWRIVGRPTARRGYVPGRSLVRGRIELDHGGGLCQLAGILYHVALTGGLAVVERYEHTRDIYTDDTRYAPLGADAAVAYGFKDLRILNTLGVPVGFSVDLAADRLTCSLRAPEPLREHLVRFVREDRADGVREVATWRARGDDDEWRLVARSRYVSGDGAARV